MLRISKLTDYGVVLTTWMANHLVGRALSVRDLAAETGIHQPTVSKILKRLAREGIVESQRGPSGGYQLAAPPAEITVAAIIAALEGPIAITECAADETAGACEYEGRCDVQANWQRINEAIGRALAGISLADMARPSSSGIVVLSRAGQGAGAAARSPGRGGAAAGEGSGAAAGPPDSGIGAVGA